MSNYTASLHPASAKLTQIKTTITATAINLRFAFLNIAPSFQKYFIKLSQNPANNWH
jgi:hypothetical protein